MFIRHFSEDYGLQKKKKKKEQSSTIKKPIVETHDIEARFFQGSEQELIA